MKYLISYEKSHLHVIDIEISIENIESEKVHLQLPSWRPGRYELGNFAKNIQKFKVETIDGRAVPFQKLNKDLWEIDAGKEKELVVKYSYFGDEINAGSTFLDNSQLYMNPCNSFMYVPERINEPCVIHFDLPTDYEIATGMKKTAKHTLYAKNFHELADCPLIASNNIKHFSYQCEGVLFHLWFQGECKIDSVRVINDFFIFTSEQFQAMGDFPFEEYHFLFQIVPVKHYHGVEHINSTAITLGPSYELMKEKLYGDLLGVSSHELYHAWNIKSIRPVEMMPYDYTRENYSRLGYVAEGVTTYYGDLFLYRSGIFSDFDYFKTLHEQLQKHMDNFGRLNYSVAQSSFDTWLDGYTKGIPHRKVSIYAEGCLLALMTDLVIRIGSDDKHSLDDVMRELYYYYAKKGIGYSEKDYIKIVEHFAGCNLSDFFYTYFYQAATLEQKLNELLDHVGCEVAHARSRKFCEAFLGFKYASGEVGNIFPGSISEASGLTYGDKILSVNGFNADDNNLDEWLKYFSGEPIRLVVKRQTRHVEVIIPPNQEVYYKIYYINKKRNASPRQREAFKKWTSRHF